MSRKMKDSKIKWIGEIPEHWEVVRSKRIIDFINGYAFNSDNLVVDGQYPVIRIGDISDSKVDFINAIMCNINDGLLSNFLIRKDDILIAMSGATVGKLGYIHEKPPKSFINQRVGIIRTKYSKFIFYSMNTDVFLQYINLLSDGSAQPNISTKNINEYKIVIAPQIEQQIIANFLDQRVSEIDHIVGKTKLSIEEYKKYKQSLITEAVTKGLNPDVEIKDSGIEWNKHIPKHWQVINGKRLFLERKDKAFEGDKQLTASQKLGIVYQEDFMKSENQKVVLVEKDFSILKHVEPNDFVISMRSFQGGLEYSTLSGCISSAYVMIIPNQKVYAPYFRWLFKSVKYINALQSTTNLVRDGQALRFSNFVQVPLLIFSKSEQKQIADYLDKKCLEIDKLITQKEIFLTELEAYKKALIYECVTGKREVV